MINETGGIVMAEQQDKQRAVEQAISQIEKQFGRGSIMKMDMDKVLDIPVISSGSLALDLALGSPQGKGCGNLRP
jgi:RecA/RadA recombinase